MPSTHSSTVLQASATNAAGNTTTSAVLNHTTMYGGVLLAQVINGGTGPTLPCSVRVDYSPDNSNWNTWEQGTAGISASTGYPFGWIIPLGAMYLRVVFTGNTAQGVTVSAQAYYVTGI